MLQFLTDSHHRAAEMIAFNRLQVGNKTYRAHKPECPENSRISGCGQKRQALHCLYVLKCCTHGYPDKATCRNIMLFELWGHLPRTKAACSDWQRGPDFAPERFAGRNSLPAGAVRGRDRFVPPAVRPVSVCTTRNYLLAVMEERETETAHTLALARDQPRPGTWSARCHWNSRHRGRCLRRSGAWDE